MSWAKDQADRLQASAAAKDSAQRGAARAHQIVTSGADALWEDLAAKVSANIEEFAAAYPPAKHLRVDRLNSNNLTVQSMVQPIVKIEIIRTPGRHIQADITKIPDALGEIRNSQTHPFRFTTDGQAVLFTDGDRVYISQQLADALCQIAADFFNPASDR
jgi:2-methylisocitrate lyase-like PEP mutase family enzyme